MVTYNPFLTLTQQSRIFAALLFFVPYQPKWFELNNWFIMFHKNWKITHRVISLATYISSEIKKSR